MPELPTSVLAHLRRLALPAAGALMLYSLPACALAQEASAGLRACATESDPARRLACYDKEMGRKPTPATQPAAEDRAAEADHPVNSSSEQASTPRPTPTAAATPAPTSAPTAAATPAPAPTSASASASAPVSTSTPTAADHEAPAGLRLPTWKMLAGGEPWRLTAHVSSLERWPDAMVLHLDNGQIWQQTGRASGDLSLHEGDSVTIQRHLGSYWLSSRYVSNMKVRQKPQ